MAQWLQLGLQNGNSSSQEELVLIHDYILVILTLVMGVVGYMMLTFLFSQFTNRLLMEEQTLELLWTIFPAIILVGIAFPSLRILYMMDEAGYPDFTLKVVGHQWYWSYEYESFDWLQFDSYMIPTVDLKAGDFRLLEVDNRVTLPFNSHIRVLITAADVLHSWTVPCLGVKVDAVPGRLNQISLFMNVPGLFYGQCSEICGANHSFMPIVVESVNVSDFVTWGMSV